MTQFKDMRPRQRAEWLAWCASHDWGGERAAWYDAETGDIVTYDCETSAPRDIHAGPFEWRVVEVRHTCPSELRAWAGY